jgi:26S proteasome regulatory subunit T4
VHATISTSFKRSQHEGLRTPARTSSPANMEEDHNSEMPESPESQPLLAPPPPAVQKSPAELRREQALQDFKKRLIEHREWEAKLKELRMGIRDLEKMFDKTEEDMKALQSVGQIVGEVLKQLDEEKFIVKASSGPRYVVGCRNKVNKAKLKQGARVGEFCG